MIEFINNSFLSVQGFNITILSFINFLGNPDNITIITPVKQDHFQRKKRFIVP